MSAKLINSAQLWRNDITGLRALAVIPVLLFHAYPTLLPGGFFGVDVFFVISGYLISRIIFRDLLGNAFSYRTFYEKRIKRILPNLLILLAFVTTLGYFLMIPEEFRSLGKHVFSSAAFYQNFRLLSEIGYFTEDALRQPLLHLWSLAIEEQFYIVFPILCAALWRFTNSRRALMGMVGLITLGSLAYCLISPNRDFNFYFPLTRFWEIGFGICLAYLEVCENFLPPKKLTLGLRHIMSGIGPCCIILPMILWEPDMVHPGWITLIPVFGTVILLASYPDAWFNRTVLSWRPMTYTGLISYSLYLWHWPILAFLFICLPTNSTLLNGCALILSFVVASLMYFLIENPIRRSTKILGCSTVSLLLFGLILALATGRTIKHYDGFPTRNLPSGIANIAHIRTPNEWDAYNSAHKQTYENFSYSVTSPTGSLPPIVFAGDSHSAQYFERAKVLSQRTGIPVAFFSSWTPNILDEGSDISKAFLKVVTDKQVKCIVLIQKWADHLNDKNKLEMLQKISDLAKERKDLTLIVMVSPPYVEAKVQGETDPLKHANRFSFNPDDFIIDIPTSTHWSDGNQQVVSIFKNQAIIIDPTPYIWPDGKCNLLKWYKDDDHLQPLRLKDDAIWLDPIFEQFQKS